MPRIEICPICGSKDFHFTRVLWSELIDQWQLSTTEVDYIDRQQGLQCVKCSSNLRSMTLIFAIMSEYKLNGTFEYNRLNKIFSNLEILEINEAGSLTSFLRKIGKHKLVNYPEYDMMNLNFNDEVFDVIIHSDTLEHIPDSLRALSECARILKPGGKCFYTVPTIVDRFTRKRDGLPPSFHGAENTKGEDLKVHTEFGVDTWKLPLQSGFSSIKIVSLDYPAGLAYVASK